MSLRCGCDNQADDTVFGYVHECAKDPGLRYTPSGYDLELREELTLDADERGGR